LTIPVALRELTNALYFIGTKWREVIWGARVGEDQRRKRRDIELCGVTLPLQSGNILAHLGRNRALKSAMASMGFLVTT
jgi:hypothetical protein